MKRTSILAILALLGVTQGATNVKSLLERAQEEDEREMDHKDYLDITNRHKKKAHHRFHPRDHTFLQEESEPRVTNEGRPLDEVRKSYDQTSFDQSDRKTDKMHVVDQHYEDHFYQGAQPEGEGKNTGTKNAPNVADHVPSPWHSVLPKSWDKLAPTNMPDHKHQGDYKAASSQGGGSGTGIYLVYLTVDSEEHASRFVKDLFRLGLIAVAEMQEGGHDRSYLKFGRIATEKGRTRLQMTTSDARLVELIDYINNENPTHYDYPVPNTVALPIMTANTPYISWVKKQVSSESGKIKYDKDE